MTSFTLYSVLLKKTAAGYKPIQTTFVFALVAFILSAIFSVSDFINTPSWWLGVSVQSILSIIYVGIFGTALYYLLMQIIIKKASPVISNLILYLQPITAIILSVIFLGETLSLFFIIGAVLSFAGVLFVTQSKTK
jgi:drug/metabolite transporter, DME family